MFAASVERRDALRAVGKVADMGKANSGWVRRNAALLLSATLAVSPVLAVPAFATQDGDTPSPIEQNDDKTTDQGGEKNPEVEKTPDAETVDSEAEKDPDAEQGTGEKDGAAADVTEKPAADQPAAEPRSGDVAQVEETDGTITPYPSLPEAVKAVNQSGGTLKLLDDTSEDITISHEGVTVTADKSVTYLGTMRINAPGCKVTGVTFRNPGCSTEGVGFDNCVELHANKGRVEDCTFDVPGGVWQSRDGKLHTGIYWQPNAVAVFQNTADCVVTGCTFKLGRVNETVNGSDHEADSNVAVNVIGPGVSNLTVSDNKMTVAAPDGVQKGASVCFIVANGNLKNGGGITNLTISGNTFDGSADEANACFVGVSGCDGIKIAGSKVTGAEYGIYGVTYQGVNKPNKFTELLDNNIDANQTMVKAEVATSDGHTYEFVSLKDAIASDHSDGATIQLTKNVTENVVVPDGKTVTLDLAGHTLTNAEDLANEQGTITVKKGGALTLTDSSEAGTGTVDSTKHRTGALVNHGTVTVEGGTLTRSKEASKSPTDNGGNSWYVVDNQGTMTFDGGKVINDSKLSSLIRNLNGTLTINDGTFENDFIALKNDDGGTLTINGGTITSDDQAVQSWSTTNISGGTLNGDVVAWDYTDSTNNCVTTISGDAVINGDVKAINYLNSSKAPQVDITGGTINGEVSKGAYKKETGVTPAEPTYEGSKITISGGSFSTRPNDALLATDLVAYQRPNRSFGVAEPGNIFNVTIDDKKAQLAKGEKVAEPEVPARVGYTFLGWFADGSDTRYDFDALVTDDLTLTQRWSLDADVSVTVDKPQPTEGDTVTLTASATSEAPGVSFAYQWLRDGKEIAGATKATLAVTTDGTYTVRVTATDADDQVWTFTGAAVPLEFAAAPAPEQPDENTYDVTFVWADGSTVTYLGIPEGSRLNPPTDAPKIDGWTFTGSWYTTRADDGTLSGEYDFSTPLSSDLTLYAGWVPAGQQGQPEVPQTTPVEQQKPADEKSGKLAQTSDPTSVASVAVAAAAGVSALAAAVATRRKRG